MKILVLEDEFSIRSFVTLNLKREGYDVIEAGSGEEAIALFDKNIGKNFLNKEKVIYCDIGNSPNPMPITFIQELIILNESIIVIIDNCNKELHNKLAEYVCLPSSKISLLTIEYDVKDDTNIKW